jgi:hypothetical protein
MYLGSSNHLEVLEEKETYVVVYSDNQFDWVVKFDKKWPESFSWANNMAFTHNIKQEGANLHSK